MHIAWQYELAVVLSMRDALDPLIACLRTENKSPSSSILSGGKSLYGVVDFARFLVTDDCAGDCTLVIISSD